MLNKDLNLKSSLCCLNLILKNMVDYDCDSDCVEYIMVDFKECSGLIRYMIADKKEFQTFLDDYGENDIDNKVTTIDITELWGEVCTAFNTEIWFDGTKKKFYIRRWYHKIRYALSGYKRNVKDKYKFLKSKYRLKLYYWKQNKAIKKRLKMLSRLGKEK